MNYKQFSKVAACGLLVASMLGARAVDVEVTTLGGGSTPGKLTPAGYRNGNTLMEAKFRQPSGIAIASDGSLIIADRANSALRLVTFPGDPELSWTSTFAKRVPYPVNVAVDGSDNIYSLNDRNGTISVYDTTGVQINSYSGLRRPTAFAVSSSGTMYVAQLDGTVWKIAPDGTRDLLASGFSQPHGVALADSRTLVVADTMAHAIRKIDLLSGDVSLITGGNGVGMVDGSPLVAKFNRPWGIAGAPNGKLVVADRLNHRIRVVATNGSVSTLYGFGRERWQRPFPGWRDGDQATAQGREPVAVAVKRDGTLYVAEAIWHTLREVDGGGLITVVTNSDGSGGTVTNTGPVTVAAPTFWPMYGFHPMGVTVTVTSTVPVYYTTDGTEPTTNSSPVSMVGNVGTLVFAEKNRDLTSLRLRAYDGTNASVVVSGVKSPLNEVGISRDIDAGIGSTVVVPVTVNLSGTNEIRSIQFRVEVTPLNGGPPILEQFRATSINSNDFIQLVTAAEENTVGVYSASPYTIGSTRGLLVTAVGTNANFHIKQFAAVAMLVIPVDWSTAAGQTYRIEVVQPTATVDGFERRLAISPMPPRTISIANRPYLVGDSSPGLWYNAGDFGDGDLGNSDVNNVFYASHSVRVPYRYTDVFNAMDAYPPEEAGGSGDGEIDSFDLNTILKRSVRLDSYNWLRHWSDGGMLVSEETTLPSAPAPAAAAKSAPAPGPGTVWLRQAALQAGSVAYALPGDVYEVPISIKVAPGCSIAGLGLRVAVVPNGNAPAVGQVVFQPAAGNGNHIVGYGVAPNEALCTWLMVPSPAFSPSLAGSNLLGYLRFMVPRGAALGQSYSIRFLKLSGGADMATPYQFEGIPGTALVQAYPSRPAEVTSDEWRQTFFGTNAVSGDMLADPDGDGVPNWQEYIDGTNPTDAKSLLTWSVTTNGDGTRSIAWRSASLKLYTVERSTGGDWLPIATNVSGDGYDKTVQDDSPPGGAAYRVRVQR